MERSSLHFFLLALLSIYSLIFVGCFGAADQFSATPSSGSSISDFDFSIESGSLYTNKDSVNLNLTASVPLVGVSVHPTQNACILSDSFLPASSTVVTDIFTTNSDNTIWVKAKSVKGKVSSCLSRRVTHDNLAPDISNAYFKMSYDSYSPQLSSSPNVQWPGVTDDSGTGIDFYEIEIRSYQANSVVQSFIQHSLNRRVNALSLIAGQNYYSIIRAVDRAGNKSELVQSGLWNDFVTTSLTPIYGEDFSLILEGDFDGDGDIDFVGTSPLDQYYYIFNNHGDGDFSYRLLTRGHGQRIVASGDYDSDGDIDLLISHIYSNQIEVLNNNGAMSFSNAVLIAPLADYTSIQVVDIDGDSDNDLVLYNPSTTRYIIATNNGAQSYSLGAPLIQSSSISSWQVVDFDGDGDMDILQAKSSIGDAELLVNDGSQNFSTTTITTSSNWVNGLVVIDFDKDGDADILATSSSSACKLCFFENDGSLSFTRRELVTSSSSVTSFFVDDYDSDGDFDFTILNTLTDRIHTLEQTSTLSFSESVYTPSISNTFTGKSQASFRAKTTSEIIVASQPTESLVMFYYDDFPTIKEKVIKKDAFDQKSVFLHDMDSDGDLDIVTTSSKGAIDYKRNNAGAGFSPVVVRGSLGGVNYAAAGDFDEDGNPDVLAVSSTGNRPYLYRQTTTDSFSQVSQSSTDNPKHVAVGDINGDTHLDYVTQGSDQNYIYVRYGNGSGGFTNTTVSTSQDSVASFIIDLNEDGNVDFITVASEFSNQNVVWWSNDGSENFTANVLFDTNMSSGKNFISAIDIDSDGDLDILTDYNSSQIGYLQNDGSENFTWVSIGLGSSEYARAVDFDGDGDIDIIASISNNSIKDGIVMFENNGANSFSKKILNGALQDVENFDIGDIDGDGKLEIVVALPNSAVGYAIVDR